MEEEEEEAGEEGEVVGMIGENTFLKVIPKRNVRAVA